MERVEQMASLAIDIMRESLVKDIKEIMSSLEQKNQQIADEITSAVEAGRKQEKKVLYLTSVSLFCRVIY